MNGFFDTVLNLVVTTKSNRKYKELQENPEEAQKSDYFGKKFIGCFSGALVLSCVALAFGAICWLLQSREKDLATGFIFVLYIICFAAAVLFALYAIIFILSRLKYVKWQRKLNDLPIGNTAKKLSYFAVVIVTALSIVAVVLAVLSIGVGA